MHELELIKHKTIEERVNSIQHKLEPKEHKTIKEKLDLSYREDYPVQAHTRSGKKVKAHTRGEGNEKANYRLDPEAIEYYDTKIQEAEDRLKEAKDRLKDHFQKKVKLMKFKSDVKIQKEAKKYRVFTQRLYYDYPIEFDEYMKMVKELSKTTIFLRDYGYFEGKRVSAYDEHIGSWDSQASLTSWNMRELSGGIKKSWRHIRWKPTEKDEDYTTSPYVYEIKGKKYVAYTIPDLKKYIKGNV